MWKSDKSPSLPNIAPKIHSNLLEERRNAGPKEREVGEILRFGINCSSPYVVQVDVCVFFVQQRGQQKGKANGKGDR